MEEVGEAQKEMMLNVPLSNMMLKESLSSKQQSPKGTIQEAVAEEEMRVEEKD